MIMLAVVFGALFAREAQAFYNPSTGRWLSRDPLNELGFNLPIHSQHSFNLGEEKGGINLYGFVVNSPILSIDRFGLDIMVIYKTSGLGHGAILIGGDDRGGWDYYSFGPKNGAAAAKGFCTSKLSTGHYDSRKTAGNALKKQGYSSFVYFMRDTQSDAAAKKKIQEDTPDKYHVTACNCVQFCDLALEAAGLTTGMYTTPAQHCKYLKDFADESGSF